MQTKYVAFFGVLLVLALLAGTGCGGADTAAATISGGNGTASLLSWDPPNTYVDNTPLDPYVDLDHYEFYAREDENFTDNDVEIAEVNAVDNQALVSAFNLDNLLPFLPPATRIYLAIRAVGVDGSKSAFSQPIAWDPTT